MANQTAQFNGEVGNIESNVNKVDTFSEDISEEAAKQKYPSIKCLMKLIDKIFPIGMILSFDTDVNPNELYGGTWERIKGAFIWGIDDGEAAGRTGGEKTHTLTEAELPAIDGRIATAVVSNHGANGVTGHAYGANFGAVSATITGTTGGAGTQYGYGYKFGGGQAHNNMPPYYGAYVWRRTA